jgi:hypothetical protein
MRKQLIFCIKIDHAETFNEAVAKPFASPGGVFNINNVLFRFRLIGKSIIARNIVFVQVL